MKMTVERYEEIKQALLSAITNEGTEWKTIVQSITDKKIKVKNWLVVRGVLQSLLDEGLIHRPQNIHSEIYKLGKK